MVAQPQAGAPQFTRLIEIIVRAMMPREAPSCYLPVTASAHKSHGRHLPDEAHRAVRARIECRLCVAAEAIAGEAHSA